MDSRTRVLTALDHREPDRVPVDFGGTVDSTIHVVAYKELRRCLGLPLGRIRCAAIGQQGVLVDEDVRSSLGSDTLSIQYEPIEWRTDTQTHGFPVEFPAKFECQAQDDGSQVFLDREGNVIRRMPRGGRYFDRVHAPLARVTSPSDMGKYTEAIKNYDKPSYLDMSHIQLGEMAKQLYDTTDSLLIGFFGGHILQAGLFLRGWEAFLIDLLTDQKLARALMDRLLDENMRRFEEYAKTVAPYVQVILVEDDLGGQNGPLMNPILYRKMIKPYHKRLYEFIKSGCDAYLLLHTDGAVAEFIPDFVEMGVDAVNPVQVSARGMDTLRLKREFGRDITFWGAGCDTQRILPFGTPEEVRKEVKRRIDDLAPGGGFVLASVHNVQAEVPPENAVALFRTAQEYGVY